MKIWLRLLKEFWFPASIALAWTIYNVLTWEVWDFKSGINIFFPSFFIASWATAQYFRVKKQAAVEQNLSNIESRVENLIGQLEKHTKDFFGYTTGADSVALFEPAIMGGGIVQLMLVNDSEYPVFDFHSGLIDLDEPIDAEKGASWTDHHFSLPHLFPKKAVMGAYNFYMGSQERLRVNIFIQTRTRGATQQFRMQRVADRILIAVKSTVGNDLVKQSIPTDFPGYDASNPDAVSS